MKAIITKYHGATDTRGSRYSATAEGVGRIYQETDYALNSDERHAAVAHALAEKHGWLRDGFRLVGGGLPDGKGCAFVFVAPMQEVLDCLPDLEHYVATHGPGPDHRLDALKAALKGGR